MPLPPPTRPHSANPHQPLPAPLFPSSASSSQPSLHRGTSMSSYTLPRETDWEDAWDSSSDKEDGGSAGKSSLDLAKGAITTNGVTKSSNSTTDPIPIRNGAAEASSSVSGSWASSFQHVSHPSSSSPHRNQPRVTNNKASPSTVSGQIGISPLPPISDTKPAGQSKLPPGGAWEIVEPSEVVEPAVIEVPKVGKEAVRADIEDILRGKSHSASHITQTAIQALTVNEDPLQLLQGLSLSTSMTPPAATSPYLQNPPDHSPSTPASTSSYGYPSTMSPDAGSSSNTPMSYLKTPRKEGLSRARSVRTERQREQFAKVLKGREEDGGSVEVG